MSEEKSHIEKTSKGRRKRRPLVIRMLLWLFYLTSFLFVIAVGLYYIAFEPWLIETIETKISKATDGRYVASVESISINILGDISINEMTVYPDSAVWDKLPQASRDTIRTQFAVSMEAVIVKDVRWIHFLQTDSLSLRSINIEHPIIDLKVNREVERDRSLVEQIEELVLGLTPQLDVKHIQLTNGACRLTANTDTSSVENEFQDFLCTIDGVVLNQNKFNSFDEREFSQKISVEIGVCSSSASNGSKLEAEHLKMSSYDSSFSVKNVRFFKEKKLDVFIPDVTVNRVGVQTYLTTRKLKVGEVLINQPRIVLKKTQHLETIHNAFSFKEQLPNSIKSFANELTVSSFNLSNADIDFRTIDGFDKVVHVNSIDSLNLSLTNFQVNDSSSTDDSRILYSDDVNFSLASLKGLKLDSSFVLNLGGLKVTSGDSVITLSDVQIYREDQFEFLIPELTFDHIHWRGYWEERKLTVEKIRLTKPDVTLITGLAKETEKIVAANLNRFAAAIDLQDVQVVDAKIEHVHHGEGKLKGQKVRNLNLRFNPIRFNQDELSGSFLDTLTELVEQFSFRDYHLALKNGVEVGVEKGRVASHYENLRLDKLYMKRDSLIRLDVEKLSVFHVNWAKYWAQGRMHIDSIKVESPVYNQIRLEGVFRDTSMLVKTLRDLPIKQALPEIVGNFGDELKIGVVHVSNGSVKSALYDSAKKVKEQIAERIDFHLYHVDVLPLNLDGKAVPDTSKILFSDRVYLDIGHFEINQDSGLSHFHINNIHVPSTDSSLILTDIDFRSNDKFDFYIPRLSLDNIDWQKYWHDQICDINLMAIDDPYVTLFEKRTLINEQLELDMDQHDIKKAVYREVKKFARQVHVNAIYAHRGTLKLDHKAQSDSIGPFEVKITNVKVDSVQVFDPKDFIFCDNITLEIGADEYNNIESSIWTSWRGASMSLIDSSLYIDRVRFKNKEGVDVFVPEVKLTGIGFNRYLRDGHIEMEQLLLDEPSVVVNRDSREGPKVRVLVPDAHIETSLKDIIGSYTDELKIGQLLVDNANLHYVRATKFGKEQHWLSNLTVSLNEVDFDTAYSHDHRPLYAKDISYGAKSYKWISDDSLYQINLKELKGETDLEQLIFHELNFSPLMSEHRYLQLYPYSRPRINFSVPNISVSGFDLEEIINHNTLVVKRIELESPELSVMEPRMNKDPGRTPPFPHFLAKELPFTLAVDSVICEHGSVTYTERSKVLTDQYGNIEFDEVSLSLGNLSNDKGIMSINNPAHAKFSSLFMNQGMFDFELNVNLVSDSLQMNYKGKLNAMAAAPLNQMIVPNSRLSVNKGRIEEVSFQAEVWGSKTEGKLLARYNDVNVQILGGRDDPDENRWLVSRLANLLIINNNTKKQADMTYNQKTTDGFFKVIWAGIRGGLINTMLPDMVIPDEDKL